MIEVDLTGELYNCMDMEYAYVDFCPPKQATSELQIDFWGLLLRTPNSSLPNIEELGFSSLTNTVFISGWSTLVFYGVHSWSLFVALYHPSSSFFWKDSANSDMCLEISKDGGNNSNTFEYDIGGSLIWPRGDAQLHIEGHDLSLCFDQNACITGKEYEISKRDLECPVSYKWK